MTKVVECSTPEKLLTDFFKKKLAINPIDLDDAYRKWYKQEEQRLWGDGNLLVYVNHICDYAFNSIPGKVKTRGDCRLLVDKFYDQNKKPRLLKISGPVFVRCEATPQVSNSIIGLHDSSFICSITLDRKNGYDIDFIEKTIQEVKTTHDNLRRQQVKLQRQWAQITKKWNWDDSATNNIARQETAIKKLFDKLCIFQPTFDEQGMLVNYSFEANKDDIHYMSFGGQLFIIQETNLGLTGTPASFIETSFTREILTFFLKEYPEKVTLSDKEIPRIIERKNTLRDTPTTKLERLFYRRKPIQVTFPCDNGPIPLTKEDAESVIDQIRDELFIN